MDKHHPPLDQFLKDVSKHTMRVLHDDGVSRHLRFRRDTSSYWFDIVTWPGVLCIDGDCGTYVFKRLNDMFEFFREKPRDNMQPGTYINAGYWAEKAVAQCKSDGITEWDKDSFVEHVVMRVRDYYLGRDKTEQLECFREVRQQVLTAEYEAEAYTALNDFRHNKFEFREAWEWSMKKYTHRFIWNLRAIAWAIHQYDTHKETHEQHA